MKNFLENVFIISIFSMPVFLVLAVSVSGYFGFGVIAAWISASYAIGKVQDYR